MAGRKKVTPPEGELPSEDAPVETTGAEDSLEDQLAQAVAERDEARAELAALKEDHEVLEDQNRELRELLEARSAPAAAPKTSTPVAQTGKPVRVRVIAKSIFVKDDWVVPPLSTGGTTRVSKDSELTLADGALLETSGIKGNVVVL